MSKKLDEIRQTIDSIDNTIHDLLMERADLVLEIGAEKKKNNIQVVQPDREARMIRRLMARHRGPLPAAAVVRIWRELVGAVCLLQTGLSVSVYFEDGHTTYWDLAKSYFGSVLPMIKTSTPLTALANVREGSTSFAVVPWPHDGEDKPWWVHLVNQEHDKMRIVCALPYGSEKRDSPIDHAQALVVSKIEFSDSGEDHSFIALELDHDISRARIVDALKGLKFEPQGVQTHNAGDSVGNKSVHLIEVYGFVAEDDARLVQISEKFKGARCVALGGYPLSPVF